MARSELPIVALNTTTGLPVAGASVQVKVRSSGANATWYTAETGGTSSTAAIVTDAAGRTNAWLDRGAYNCIVSGTGITTYTEPFDSSPASDGSIDSLWLPSGVVQTTHFATGAVDNNALAANAVSGPKIAAASVDNTHLATAAKNLFLQLGSAGTLRMKYGVTDAMGGGSWGIASSVNATIPHGAGTTPVWANFTTDTGVTTGDTDDVILGSIRSLDATNINIRLFTRSGGNANLPGVNIYWIVFY